MKIISFFVIFALLLFSAVFLFGCNTFKPTKIKGEPQECNDMYTLMDFSTRMSGFFKKSNTSSATALTLTTLSYADCKKAREAQEKKKRFEDCKKMIYGEKLKPKKDNYKMYADFADCRMK